MKITRAGLLKKLRILPILIIVASIGFVIRVGDTVINIQSLRGTAHAEEAAKAPAPETTKKEEATKTEVPKKEDKITINEDPAESPKWQDASDANIDDSEVREGVYADLRKRREDLEMREKKLSEREALLAAAEKEVDKKVKEMEGLRDELRDLLKQQTAAEAARIQSLVKIYSGMKPKDAARIFDTLDTDTLMDIISHMPESKAGGIMALMDANRAKALTTLLAEQKKLPDMP